MKKMPPLSPLFALFTLPFTMALGNIAVENTQPPTMKPTIVARYPHSTAAFTQGLQYLGAGEYLEGTGAIDEPSVLRKVNLTGKEIKSIPLGLEAFGEGVTLFKNKIYQLTWQDGLVRVRDAATWQLLNDLHYSGEGWGLTHDGQHLIMSNGTPTLTWRDPETFAVLRSLEVKTPNGEPIERLNELEYAKGELWANVWLTDKIVRIDPDTGLVRGWIDVSALSAEVRKLNQAQGRSPDLNEVPNGIAYDPRTGHFFLTGKRWPLLFEVSID